MKNVKYIHLNHYTKIIQNSITNYMIKECTYLYAMY